MRLYSLIDFQHMVLAFFLGLGFVILVYLAWGSRFPRRGELNEEELKKMQGGEFGSDPYEKGNSVGPMLIIIYVGALLWSLSYMVAVGLRGAAF